MHYYYESPAFWLSYYQHQAVQSGHGLDGFRGAPYQRGAGLGSFFKSLFQVAVPILRQAAKSTARRVGRQAVTAIGNIATDVTGGRDLKESLVSRGKEAASNVLHETADALQSGSGLGFRPRTSRTKVPAIKRRSKSKKRSVKKRRHLVKSDIFSSRP